jgi:hypothetical protein
MVKRYSHLKVGVKTGILYTSDNLQGGVSGTTAEVVNDDSRGSQSARLMAYDPAYGL